ncbi:MAG: transposase [Planctomycetota bacterium]|nr:MAG: transposase [Planctomycetota bacterium]
MTIARKNLVDPTKLEHIHLISRCARRSFIMGTDSYSGKNFDHRKEWIQDRLKHLVNNYSIEVGSYAIMDNHIHILVRNRSDLNLKLSDRDVVDRWVNLYTPRLSTSKKVPYEIKLENHKLIILKNSERMAELRLRLSSVSWFMKTLKEFIARKANKEDECKGTFWEARFKSQLLTSHEAVILCQTYIDLNPIRAGIATTPEGSKNTSAYERIRVMQSKENIKLSRSIKNEQGEFTQKQKGKIHESFIIRNNDKWLAPFYKGYGHTKCFYQFVTQKEYLELLDWSGREIKEKKSGAIPSHLKPIFDRLEIDRGLWIDALKNYKNWFQHIVGDIEKAWKFISGITNHHFKGGKENRQLFHK